MGQPARDRDQPPGPPEAFDEFYVPEYPRVVGLLQGLLRSRIVAEELAQETFLVDYSTASQACRREASATEHAGP